MLRHLPSCTVTHCHLLLSTVFQCHLPSFTIIYRYRLSFTVIVVTYRTVIYCHLPLSTISQCHHVTYRLSLSFTVIYCHSLSSTVTHCHFPVPSFTIIYRYLPSLTAIYCYLPSFTVIYCRPPSFTVTYCHSCIVIYQWRSKLDNWGGGGHICIYSSSQTMKTINSNETNCAEHEYMNMCPPPQLLSLPLTSTVIYRHSLLFTVIYRHSLSSSAFTHCYLQWHSQGHSFGGGGKMRAILGVSGGMLPRKILKSRVPQMRFPAFSG